MREGEERDCLSWANPADELKPVHACRDMIMNSTYHGVAALPRAALPPILSTFSFTWTNKLTKCYESVEQSLFSSTHHSSVSLSNSGKWKQKKNEGELEEEEEEEV